MLLLQSNALLSQVIIQFSRIELEKADFFARRALSPALHKRGSFSDTRSSESLTLFDVSSAISLTASFYNLPETKRALKSVSLVSLTPYFDSTEYTKLFSKKNLVLQTSGNFLNQNSALFIFFERIYEISETSS